MIDLALVTDILTRYFNALPQFDFDTTIYHREGRFRDMLVYFHNQKNLGYEFYIDQLDDDIDINLIKPWRPFAIPEAGQRVRGRTIIRRNLIHDLILGTLEESKDCLQPLLRLNQSGRRGNTAPYLTSLIAIYNTYTLTYFPRIIQLDDEILFPAVPPRQ